MENYCKNCKHLNPPKSMFLGLGYFWGECKKKHKNWKWDEDVGCPDFKRSGWRTFRNGVMQE